MKSLDEYKKEIEQDPKARRRLKKLEKEFEAVEESLTDEELVKYGLKPAEPDAHDDQTSDDPDVNEDQTSKDPDAQDYQTSDDPDTLNGQKSNDLDMNENQTSNEPDALNSEASSVIDLISRKI